MVFGFLGDLFSRGKRLPADQVTRTSRTARKAAAASIQGMQAVLDQLGALGGIADIKENRRVPRGFFALVKSLYGHYDQFEATVSKHMPIPPDGKRPGEPGGTNACYAAPLGVHTIEALNIYRTARSFRDFPELARRLGELGEAQFKEIQVGYKGKDPQKIRMGGRAVREGRLNFARKLEPCPFLDQEHERCRIWDQRPLVCRMQHPTTPPEWSRPDHAKYPAGVRSLNVRPPVRVQVALAQLDKRTMLQTSPFLYAGVLQVLELSQGQVLHEVGEAPMRLQQDGSVAQRANRNVKHAKKFQAKAKRNKKK